MRWYCFLSHLSIASESHSLGNQWFERRDVKQWGNIESDESVVDAFVNDTMDVFESVRGVRNTTTTQSSDEDGRAEDARERRTISSVVEMAELFGGLEDLATECQVSDALSYLRSAKRASLTAKHDRDPKRSRRTLITECMK